MKRENIGLECLQTAALTALVVLIGLIILSFLLQNVSVEIGQEWRNKVDQVLVEFLASLPLHGLLIVAIVVLWSENRRLMAKLDQMHEQSKANGAVLQDQNKDLAIITTHITGNTPPRGLDMPHFSDS